MENPRVVSRRLEKEWQELADEFLPIQTKDQANWRYSRPMRPEDPTQGWKLHISATILNAVDVFKLCAPYLRSQDILFKACTTIDTLSKLNSGILFGFSQIGKFITVYPQTAALARRVAADLDKLLANFRAPRVPYDLSYRPGSCVHYRYGGFRMIEVVLADGQKSTAIRDPSGKLWTDRREPGYAVPDWLTNPFEVYAQEVDPQSPLCTQFLTYDALSQRGKGGIYLGVDIRNIPARKCVLKEGRRHGETSIDGRDGWDLVIHEEEVLSDLRKNGARVPEVLANFMIDDHRYLALEFIEGDNLMALCSHPRRKLSLSTADAIAARIASVMAEVHDAGWVWRDCKPLNLIVSRAGDVRPVDFEGAVRFDAPSSIMWGTPGYTPPELSQGPVTGSNLPEDLFALGATLHQLYTSLVPITQDPGKEPKLIERRPVGSLRRGVHPNTRQIIARLLDPNPVARPAAREAANELIKRLPANPVVIDASKHRRRLRRKDIIGRQLPLGDDLPGVEPVVLQTPNSRKVVAA